VGTGEASKSESTEAIEAYPTNAAVARCPFIGVVMACVKVSHARRASLTRAHQVSALAGGRAPGAMWRYN
jgi:hypothetical protein